MLLWVLLTLYMFKALGTVCDEYFVPSLEMISEKLELSNDVAGATFMAAGSSAPELFTSIVATFLIVNEGGVGAIIGSAIFNILVIVGATCVCAGQVLHIWWYPLARDCSFYVLSIVELALFIMDDEVIQWWEALIMFLSYVAYCVYMKFNEKVATLIRKETKVDIMDVEQRYGVAGDSPVKDGDDSPCNQSEGDKADIADKKEHKEKKKDMEVGFTAIVQTVAIPNDIPSKSVETGEGDAASSTSGGTGGTGDPGHMHIVRSMKELKRQKTFAAAFTEAEAKKFSAVLEQQNERK
jgi:Ca2+/Na+ antiporter